MNEEWKKPQALKKNRFEDVAKLVGITPSATHYAKFDLLLNGGGCEMNMREFARIVNAGKLVDGKIKGIFFLNPTGLLRLYD